jgi:hypothetical protein
MYYMMHRRLQCALPVLVAHPTDALAVPRAVGNSTSSYKCQRGMQGTYVRGGHIAHATRAHPLPAKCHKVQLVLSLDHPHTSSLFAVISEIYTVLMPMNELEKKRRRAVHEAEAACGEADTDAAYMRMHAAPTDDTHLSALGWTFKHTTNITPSGVVAVGDLRANEAHGGVPRRRQEAQSDGRQRPARVTSAPVVVPQPSSAVRAVCYGALKLLVGIGLLLGVLVVVLLALPDAELEGDAVGDSLLSGDAQMGNWDAAFFCNDEPQRAGRILKASNFVARAAGMSNGHSNESDACVVVRRALMLTNELHSCVTDLWRKRGASGDVTPAQLRHPDAWWNAIAKSAIKSAPLSVLERSQALHLALSLQLPWVVETLVSERKVGVSASAGPCQLTPLLRAVRAGDKDAVLLLYRAGANLSAPDCRGCLAQDLETDTELAWQLRTWTQCSASASIEQCLSAHHGHGGSGGGGGNTQEAQEAQETQEVELVGDTHAAQQRLAWERGCRDKMLEAQILKSQVL